MIEEAFRNELERDDGAKPDTTAQIQADYCGIPLDEWKEALRKDVVERFGSAPADLPPKGEPGW